MALRSESTVTSKRSREEVEDEPATKRTKQERKEKKSRSARASPREAQEENASRTEVADSPGASTAELKDPAGADSLALEANARNEGHVESRAKKHRKKKELKMLDGSPGTNYASWIAKDDVNALGKRKTKKKKRTTEEANAEVGVAVTQEKEDGSRHKKLMEKRKKSMRKAEKLVNQSKSESAGEGIDVEREEIPVEVHDLVPLPQPDPIPELPALSSETSLPPWLAAPIRVFQTSTASFSEVGIEDDVAKVLEKRGFKEAFAVQAAVLPLLLPGNSQKPGDVLVSAATGSGKTLAYVLPMVEDMSWNQTRKLRGLIVMPTRELVTQAKEVCEICVSAFPIGSGRRRVEIGTAVGNETLKVEQDMLMTQELFYDPVEYKKQQLRLNEKWESSENGSDEELLCDEEVVSTLPDHVFRPMSRVDILICTPGRLVEHIKSTPGFSLEYIRWLVVDEADKLLDQSFQQWLEVVMAGLDSNGEPSRSQDRVRKVILSATMTRDAGLLNPLKLYRPKLVTLEATSTTWGGKIEIFRPHILPSLLLESGVKVEAENIKPLYLMELLKRESILSENQLDESSSDTSDDGFATDEESSKSSVQLTGGKAPTSTLNNPRGVLIFTKSNESAIRLGRLVALLAPSSSNQIGTLTSTTPRAARKSTLKSFAAGRVSILVASDLVSRGLDIPNLAHVINYDLPNSLTSYVHRIGRTARAGKQGHAWTLFTSTEGRWFWNEIGRIKGVERSGRKIERVNIKEDFFGEEQRGRYEEALEELGREARNSRPGLVVD